MIITVQAFNDAETAVNVTAAMAAMNAYKYKNTTAIIQLTEAVDKDVVDVMIGNNIQSLTKNDEIGFGANGIDEIIRSTQYDTIDKENIMTMCAALTTEKGRLDALRRTEMTDFVETSYADMDNIMQILKATAEAYKVVFVIMPVMQNNGEFANIKFVKSLNESEIVDASIYCFPQGPVNRIKNYNPTGKKIIYCCTDFEPSSIYGCKYFKKEFGHRIVYGLHYNVGYRDALLSENVIDYVRRNKNTSSTDVNYWWNKSVCEILKYGLGISEYEEPKEELRIPADEPYVEEPNLRDIDVTRIQEEQIKKGKFFKKKATYLNTSQAIMDEVEEQAASSVFEEEDNISGEYEEYVDNQEEELEGSEGHHVFEPEKETEFFEDEDTVDDSEQEYGEDFDTNEEVQNPGVDNPMKEEKQAEVVDTEMPEELGQDETFLTEEKMEEIREQQSEEEEAEFNADTEKILKLTEQEEEQEEIERNKTDISEKSFAPFEKLEKGDFSEDSIQMQVEWKDTENETESEPEAKARIAQEETLEKIEEDKTTKEEREDKQEADTEESVESVYDKIRQIPKDLDDRAYNAVVAHILASNK